MTYMGVGWLDHQLVQLYTANVADQRSSAVTSASWFTFNVHVFRLPSEGEANASVLVIWGTLRLCQTIATGFSSVNAASCFTFPAEKNMWQGWHLRQSWNGTKNSVKLAQKENHPGVPGIAFDNEQWNGFPCLPDQMWKAKCSLCIVHNPPSTTTLSSICHSIQDGGGPWERVKQMLLSPFEAWCWEYLGERLERKDRKMYCWQLRQLVSSTWAASELPGKG